MWQHKSSFSVNASQSEFPQPAEGHRVRGGHGRRVCPGHRGIRHLHLTGENICTEARLQGGQQPGNLQLQLHYP